MNRRNLILFITFQMLFGTLTFAQSEFKHDVLKTEKQMKRKGEKFNYRLFDETSSISVNQLTEESLAGLWESYTAVFRYYGNVQNIILPAPILLKMTEDSCKRHFSPTEDFVLTDNHLVVGEGVEEGFVNKISEDTLVITWIQSGGYVRYYYRKAS